MRVAVAELARRAGALAAEQVQRFLAGPLTFDEYGELAMMRSLEIDRQGVVTTLLEFNEWEWAAETALRALVRGPGVDGLGFSTVITTIANDEDLLRCGVPMLPPYRSTPALLFAPVFESDLDATLNEPFTRGLAGGDALSTRESTVDGNVRVEHLGPRIERDDRYRYFVGDGAILRQPHAETRAGMGERILEIPPKELTWFYFIDIGGELARVPHYQFALVPTWMLATPERRLALRYRE